MKKRRQLEDENRRLKQMVAEQAFDIQALEAINAKNWQRPRRSGPRLSGWRRALGAESGRVCRLMTLDRNTLRYRSRCHEDDEALRIRIREIVKQIGFVLRDMQRKLDELQAITSPRADRIR